MRRGLANLVGGLALVSVLAIGNPFAAYATGDVAQGDVITSSIAADLQQNGDTTEVSPQADEPVAEVNGAQYSTIDEAVEKAPEGSTITLLADCEMTKGFNKTLTFTGTGKITINKQLTSNGEGWMCFGLYDPNRVLTFDGPDVSVEWNSEVGTSPWLLISLSGTLNVTNGASLKFTVDSGSGNRNAIYMNAGSEINVTNGSKFEIKGYDTAGKEGQGLQLDQAGTAKVNVTGGSTFTIDGTNRGYVNSPEILVDGSTFTVKNCTANASNGGLFTATNKSMVTYENNAGHGLSAGSVTLSNGSTLTADNNGYYGVYTSGGFSVDGTSTLNVTRNSYDGDFAGLKLTKGVADGKVERGAIVKITDNYCSGLSNNGKVVFEEGVKLTITGNLNDKGTNSHGGGIYNSGDTANLVLPSNTVLYNNHAKTDGDDIFNNTTATISFGQTGSDWKLDGVGIDGAADDCTDAIDGWYDDSANARWEAHADSYDGIHVDKFTNSTTAVTGLTALKAAHGLGTVAVTPADITIYMGGDEGYEGTATDEGSITGSNSLPEPGFYLTLSDDINAALQKAGHATEGEAADLSQFLKLYTVGYTVDGEATTLNWTLEQYGETHSGANNKFIYRIVPAPTEGQEAVPVRLQFTSPDGSQTFTNDTFDPNQTETLYQQYEMQLYTELVDQNQVVFEVKVGGEHFYNTMQLETGKLTIRYVTGDQDSVVSDVVTSASELAAAKAENPDKAYALHSENAKFFINGSQVDVTDDAAPSLLFDDVVSDNNTDGAADYDQQLANRATDVIRSQGSTLVNPWFQAKYLDLVDANNGNTWLTTNEPTTVYWPYPAGTDENTEFHLVHFEGLNREISNGEIADQIAGANAEYVAVENTEHGIRFQTDGFSPFVLIWDAGEDAGEQPEPQPPVTKGESGGLPTTGDYTLMGAAVAAIAGVAALGYGVYASKRTH